jgi:hypothetical protein
MFMGFHDLRYMPPNGRVQARGALCRVACNPVLGGLCYWEFYFINHKIP